MCICIDYKQYHDYIYIQREVCLWLFLVCGIPQFCLFVTWSACFVTCSTIVCYMVNHGRLHGRSLSVTQQSIVCYIVEHCVLHGRALYVTWWACFVTWQIIVCYMVELCLYQLEHCLSHHRALFVTTSRSFVVQSKIWCVTWKTIICYGEMCVAWQMMVCYKKDLYVLKVIIAVWYIVNYDVCYKVDYYGLQYRSVCVTWQAIE